MRRGVQGGRARDGGLFRPCKNLTLTLSVWEAAGGLGAQEGHDPTAILTDHSSSSTEARVREQEQEQGPVRRVIEETKSKMMV